MNNIVKKFKLKRKTANARKWKHNFGGLLKAEEGTKFDWGGLAKNIGSTAMSIIAGNKKVNAYQEETNFNLELDYLQALQNLLNKSLELKNNAFNLWMQLYQSGLTQDNPSQIVLAHLFNPDVSLLKNDYNNKKAMNKFKVQQYKNDLLVENISDIGSTIAGSISNYYANKNTTPTIAPTESVDTTFTKIKTPKITYNPNMMNLSLT